MTFANSFRTESSRPKPARKRKSKGISTGYDPKTGKVGYTRSVKATKPKQANYASAWAAKTKR